MRRFSVKSTMMALWLAAILFAGLSVVPAQIHVAVAGNDQTGNGTAASPFASLKRALQASGNLILIESGQYVLAEPLVIGPGRTVEGGFKIIPFASTGGLAYAADGAPTVLLAVGVPGSPALRVDTAALLRGVSIFGGFYSVELLPGGRIFEVEFGGGQFASIMIRTAGGANPAYVERCRILGGGTGIRVDGAARASILETMIRDVQSGGIALSGTGTVTILNSVIQGALGDGITITGNNNAGIQNCVVRRCSGDGIRISRAAPLVRGCLVEQNRFGIRISDSTNPQVSHCTIVGNRESGVYMRLANPNLDGNIIANNGKFGVQEDNPGSITETDPDGNPIQIPAPTHGGFVVRNILWQNSSGQYLDENSTIIASQADLDSAIVNTGEVSANIIADPLFLDVANKNYRLSATSPAIDAAPIPGLIPEDLEGNSRTIDIPGVGDDGPTANVADLGAYELQNEYSIAFATITSDNSKVPDPTYPGQQTNYKRTSEWEYLENFPGSRPVVDFLPGRIRLKAPGNEALGIVARHRADIFQDSDKILIIDTELAALAPSGRPGIRMRLGEASNFDIASTFGVWGDAPFSAETDEKPYPLIVDLVQGGYRRLGASLPERFNTGFFIDYVDFFNQSLHTGMDVRGVRVRHIDRAIFDAQFDRQIAFDSFNPGDPIVWTNGGVGPPVNTPRFRYDAIRGGLEIRQLADFSFGTWASPPVPIARGTRFKVDFKVSTQQSGAAAPAFRLRIMSLAYPFIQEMIVLPTANGSSTPPSDGERYTMYGYMPNVDYPTPYPAQTGDIPELTVFFDLMGFSYDNRSPTGSVLLEEVRITAATNPLY